MAEIGLVTATWSGISGGLGVTTLAFARADDGPITATDAQNAVDNVRAFMATSAAVVPGGVTITVSPVVEVYDDISGVIQSALSAATPPAAVSGAASGAWANGVGYRIDWNTSFVRRRKRTVGRTYIVPASSLAFATDGTLDNANRTTLQGAGTTLLSAMATDGLALCVWCRPTGPTANDGASPAVLSATVPDKAAIVRSRRD